VFSFQKVLCIPLSIETGEEQQEQEALLALLSGFKQHFVFVLLTKYTNVLCTSLKRNRIIINIAQTLGATDLFIVFLYVHNAHTMVNKNIKDDRITRKMIGKEECSGFYQSITWGSCRMANF
jgi:hypothetical protein